MITAVVSPKFHMYVTIVEPFDGIDAVASMTVTPPSTVGLGDTVKLAVGKVDDTPTTVTARATVTVPPALSVTVNSALKTPAAVKEWLVVTPVPVMPSPKFHEYVAIVRPAGAVEAVPLNWTAVVVVGAVGEKTKPAVARRSHPGELYICT